MPWPILVSMTGWPGMMYVESSPTNLERDWYWRTFALARMVGISDNPGHQQGAGWCIRQGVEAAHYMGCKYMIHTAEDVIFNKMPDGKYAGAYLVDQLRAGHDYAGMVWGYHDEHLNSQVFACRVDALVSVYDPRVLNGEQHTEWYLHSIMSSKRMWTGPPLYYHTHNYEEWKKYLLDIRGGEGIGT